MVLRVGVAAIVLLMGVVPFVKGPTPCLTAHSLPMTAQAPPSPAPQTGCGSDLDTSAHFSTACAVCGAVLLPEWPIFPAGTFFAFSDPLERLDTPLFASLFWHPPA